MEADSMGGQLGSWLIENKIIQHIFGPNLHVEVCIILFLFSNYFYVLMCIRTDITVEPG